jgi:hypothetical protein
MVVVVVTGVAQAMLVVITVGMRRHHDTGQRDSKRHRRYHGDKTLRVHMDAPKCSHHNFCESYEN